MSYSGKVAIVTGGAGGIGLGITKHLLSSGAKVVIADVNATAGAKVIEGLAADGKVAFCATDVTSWTSTVALFEFAYKTFGPRVDFVFANAGIAQMKEMRSSDPTHFSTAVHDDLSTLADRPPSLKVIEVDLHGVLYSLHAALAYYRKQDKDADGWRGKFLATGSNASFYVFPNDALYGAAKHGIWGAVKATGVKVLPEGITVNCFGPSVVASALAPPGFNERLTSEGRITPLETIFEGIDIFLAPKSRLTGQCIENCGTENVFRQIPPFMDDKARLNMSEFHDSEDIEKATSVEGYGLRVL